MSTQEQHDPREVFVRLMRAELSARIRGRDGDPMRFEAGRLEGPIDDRDVGCVWFEGTRPHSRAGIVGEHYYRVRVFRRWRQTVEQGNDGGAVHAALLELQRDLEAALASQLAGTPGHDYYVVREVSPDYVGQHVEAQLTAFCDNPTAPGM